MSAVAPHTFPPTQILLLLPGLALCDTYGAPAAPLYSAQPQQTSYSAQLPDHDYYKHEHHHYYHAGPPKVVHVKVPVTQKPYGKAVM